MRVLVVEDHPIFLDGLQLLLATHKPDTTLSKASSAEQALALLDDGPKQDVIVLDLNLPGIDGIDFLAALNERALFVPTLTMSAEVNVVAIRQALAAGALGFIAKTAAGTELLSALDTVSNGSIYIAADIEARLSRGQRAPAQPADLPERAQALGVTPRQYGVLKLMSRGFSNRQIAQSLSLTEHTIKSHVRALFAVLDAENRTSCVRRAESMGIITPP